MTFDTLLEIFGLLIGLLYLWYEYHADAKVWITSIIMPMISMWIYFSKGLYADFAINIYYVAIAIYGYLAWTFKFKKDKTEKRTLPISHIKPMVAAASAIAFGVIWIAIYYVLDKFTNSTVPVADAFTTALSIVALWMLARKFIEQWLVWAVVDAVCVWLYIYKGIYFYAGLYAIYTILAFVGFYNWLKLMRQQ